MAGAGNKERHESKFNVNSFKAIRQMFAIGMGNNDNGEGFTFMDILNFSGELAKNAAWRWRQYQYIRYTWTGSRYGYQSRGRNGGITTAWGEPVWTITISLGTKFDLQSNYFYNRMNPERKVIFNGVYSSGYIFYNQNSFSDNWIITTGWIWTCSSWIHWINVAFVPSLSYQRTK